METVCLIKVTDADISALLSLCNRGELGDVNEAGFSCAHFELMGELSPDKRQHSTRVSMETNNVR